jgi:hypothetical protein
VGRIIMQKIFDVNNKEDMDLLWSILPSEIKRIKKENPITYDGKLKLLKIGWHDKTEITRPMQEATEQDTGKICAFWDNDGRIVYGLLSDLIIEESKDRKYGCVYGNRWEHARRLTKQEIEELC